MITVITISTTTGAIPLHATLTPLILLLVCEGWHEGRHKDKDEDREQFRDKEEDEEEDEGRGR